jgi:hypothetical protein
MSALAEMADKFTRNEIVTSNEMRQFIGMKPSADPKADQLVNSNMPQSDTGVPSAQDSVPADNVAIDTTSVDTTIDPAEQELNRQMAELGIT